MFADDENVGFRIEGELKDFGFGETVFHMDMGAGKKCHVQRGLRIGIGAYGRTDLHGFVLTRAIQAQVIFGRLPICVHKMMFGARKPVGRRFDDMAIVVELIGRNQRALVLMVRVVARDQDRAMGFAGCGGQCCR